MQERCGNYWKRHDIIWREHTMLQAAFMPYLPPPASYLPASLIYRLAKPRWGSQIICVIKFILAKRTRPFIQTFLFFFIPPRVKQELESNDVSAQTGPWLCVLSTIIDIIKTCSQQKHKGKNIFKQTICTYKNTLQNNWSCLLTSLKSCEENTTYMACAFEA